MSNRTGILCIFSWMRGVFSLKHQEVLFLEIETREAQDLLLCSRPFHVVITDSFLS